jgi:hypothetical protein
MGIPITNAAPPAAALFIRECICINSLSVLELVSYATVFPAAARYVASATGFAVAARQYTQPFIAPHPTLKVSSGPFTIR